MAAGDLELVSAIVLTILAMVTVVSNGLLLIAIWKDPLKCFKSATTYFVVGLSLADLTTGLTVEPFFAIFYFVRYFQGIEKASNFAPLYKAGSTISTVAICYSFLIVLALSWSQFIAIRWPHRYKQIVTKRNVAACILASFLYLLAFTLTLQYAGVLNEVTFLKIQLAVHASFLSVNLIVISVLLFVVFRRRLSNRATSVSTRNDNAASKREQIERQFTAVAMYLAAILLLAALPHVCTAQLYLYLQSSISDEVKLNFIVALRISDLLLFVKVCLDPFIYAWRLPHYRRTLNQIFSGCRVKRRERGKSGSSSSSGSLLGVRQVARTPLGHARRFATRRALDLLITEMVKAIKKTRGVSGQCSTLAILLSQERETKRQSESLHKSDEQEKRNLRHQIQLLSEENDKLKDLLAKERDRNETMNDRYEQVWNMYTDKRDGFLRTKWKRFRQALSSLRRRGRQ